MLRIGILGASHIGPYAIFAPAIGRIDLRIGAVAASDPVRAHG